MTTQWGEMTPVEETSPEVGHEAQVGARVLLYRLERTVEDHPGKRSKWLREGSAQLIGERWQTFTIHVGTLSMLAPEYQEPIAAVLSLLTNLPHGEAVTRGLVILGLCLADAEQQLGEDLWAPPTDEERQQAEAELAAVKQQHAAEESAA